MEHAMTAATFLSRVTNALYESRMRKAVKHIASHQRRTLPSGR
jgi:hypothetical protein